MIRSEETEELWRASDSELETFSDAEGADENGEWPVEIIGEEVDWNGVVRYEVHEARWGNWTRPDKSNVTWNNDFLFAEHLKYWRRMTNRQRRDLADDSLDISIWGTLDPHNTSTILRSQAYAEKLQKRRKTPLKLGEEMGKLLAEKMRPISDEVGAARMPNLRATSARQQSSRSRSDSTSSTMFSFTFSTGRNASASSMSSHSATSLPQSEASTSHADSKASNTSNFSKHRDSTFSKSSSTRGRWQRKTTVKQPPQSVSATKRQALQKRWTALAKEEGAAPITIINDIDDEELPSLVRGFQYLESKYIYAKDVPSLQDEGCFVVCDCDFCNDASKCNCQDPSELFDDFNQKQFAYTPDGLFAFNHSPGIEVIECNRYCKCDDKCPNRVAQRPRDIPIEIFKTQHCGWGVRTNVALERGKVLGLYTGLLILRETAENLPRDKKDYCFDLDGRESGEGEPDNAYTVDSRTCGNWTRLINHSCAPNLRVYLVVFDTIPEMNTPYLAFVATEDIPPRTELTFDYDPDASRAKGRGRGKGKTKIPPGAKLCMCGAEKCRGWLNV